MPFICLANANVPEGILQVTDLWPNVSQDNNPTNPAGQTRYLRRAGTDNPAVNLTTGLVEGSAAQRSLPVFNGLGAYLVDRVEPGSLEESGVTITLAGVVATDQIVIKGFYFEFAAGANDLLHAGTVGDPVIVGLGAGDNDAAANLTLALNDGANVGAGMDLIAPLNIHTVATNPGAPSAVVQVSVEDGAAAAVLGSDGDFTLTDGGTGAVAAGRITSGGTEFTVGRFQRASEAWDFSLVATTVTAIMAEVDAPTGDLSLANLNALLLANCGAELTGAAATSASTGALTDVLWILSGRSYDLPKGAAKFTAATAPDQVHLWDATQRGGFTENVTTFANEMLGGEWGPVAGPWLKYGSNKVPTVVGGDATAYEHGPARQTFHSTHLAASLNSGQLFRFANGITLFPDADVQAYITERLPGQPIQRQATLVNQRVVTVYDDDGTLLI
jgi:hypothetical protein